MAEAEFVVKLESQVRRTLRPQKRGPKARAAADGAQLSLGVS